jgi:hypothetical protein
MLYKSDGFTPDDPFDSEIPLPAHIAERLRKKSDSPIDVSGDADRLRRIFSEHPDLKAAAEEGTMRVSVSGSVERWEIVDGKSAHVFKRLGEDQHDAIKESAARITALVEQHPYLANAIKDRWATVKVQDDGTLGIEFSQGRHVELSAFDESTSVSKSGAIGKAHRAHQEIEIALVGYRESRGERFDDAGI